MALACLAAASAVATAGALTFNGTLTFLGGPSCNDPCSEFSMQGHGVIRGLGAVRYSGTGLTDSTPPACGKSAEQLTVTISGKGTFALDGTVEGCTTPTSATLNRTTTVFRVSGGTDKLQGITGSVTFDSNGVAVTATGNLAAPSFTFDLAPPKFIGAVSHTAKALTSAGARVRFSVSAVDAVDGALKASCDHRSGSVFRVGSTRVTCSATDSSANAGRVTFIVKVTRA